MVCSQKTTPDYSLHQTHVADAPIIGKLNRYLNIPSTCRAKNTHEDYAVASRSQARNDLSLVSL